MTKFSFIIPIYGQQPNNLQFCLDCLLQQTFKDFEIIICGNKVQNEIVQYLNGIKIINVVIDGNNISKFINNSIKLSSGDFIHLWQPDLIVYADYLENLNQYILKYGNNNLYAGKIIDTRYIDARKNSSNFYFNSSDKSEGYNCFHKDYFESFREEFNGGLATHCYQEFNFRLWKKMKFICMRDVEVIHIPHPSRMSYEESIITSQKSWILFEAMKHES